MRRWTKIKNSFKLFPRNVTTRTRTRTQMLSTITDGGYRYDVFVTSHDNVNIFRNAYRGKRPRMVLAVIGGAINSSSIMSSVSSSPVSDDEDFDWNGFESKLLFHCQWQNENSCYPYRMRLIGIKHLHLVIFSAGRCAPHLFTRRTFLANVLHRLLFVVIINRIQITSIPSTQICVDESSRLFQKGAGPMCPVARIRIVYFFRDNFDFC